MLEKKLAQHFNEYFSIYLADTIDYKKKVFKLRYDVYCTELGYEKDCPIDCEKDHFDDYSTHVLITHNASGATAGCIRLVTPPFDNKQAALPFEVYCLQSVDAKKIEFLKKEGKIYLGEVSRIAVHGNFRRRFGEKTNPSGVNISSSLIEVSDDEMRYFPYIAVALYLASVSLAIRQGLKYVVVMMEPRLAKHLSRFGICFIQLSNVINFHGERALFYIDYPTLIKNFKPELEEFYQFVDNQLKFKKKNTDL